MSSSNTAVIYLETVTNRISGDELDRLLQITAWARENGWCVEGALIEPISSYASADWTQLRREFECGTVQAVIDWDPQHDEPGVWTDDLPVKAPWP